MHRVIVGSIVVVLAGACWVVAQNASSKERPEPYRQSSGVLPNEKAAALTVAPPTALDSPPGDPSMAIPPRAEFFTASGVPPLDPPPGTSSDIKPVSNVAQPAMLPPLPPVPGVAGPPLPASDARSRYDGIVVPQPAKPIGDPVWNGNQAIQNGAPPPKSDVSMNVDPPNYWRERQRMRERWNEVDPFECRTGPRIWGSAEYLLWFVRPQTSPPLVQAVSGVGAGDTSFNDSQLTTLFPYDDIDYGITSGVRGTVGFWLNPAQTFGFEASYMWLGQAELRDSYQSTNAAILGRALVDADTGRNNVYQVSSPGFVDGLITIRSTLRLEGGEANFLFNSGYFGPQFNLLAGFRYLEMNERLRVSQFSNGLDFSISSFDQFSTRNQFWGGQVGLKWGYQGRRLVASVTGKVAIGAMYERVNINGGTTVSNAFGTESAEGGVLALSSNIGSYSRTRTALVPEAIVNLGYRFAPWGTVSVGYNFLYVTEVVRPGGQMDNVVNTSNLPFAGGTSGRPSFLFKGEDFWAQGINFGLMVQY